VTRLLVWILVALLCGPATLDAQEPEAEEAPSDSATTKPGNTLVPLPVLFYQPETKLGFGGLVSYYF
jgi:hypothetical protein